MMVRKYVEKMGSSFGAGEVISSEKGMFLIKFDKEEGVGQVKEVIPWSIGDAPFLVRKWTLNLLMLVNDIKKVVVWIKFFCIPLEY